MKRLSTAFAILLLALAAACTQMPPTAQDLQAKRVETAPGKAVIFVVRTKPDVSYEPAAVMLDGQLVGTTYAGSSYRLEVAPGRHQLKGYGADTGSINLDVQADRIYFVQHAVVASRLTPNPMSFFTLMSDTQGRAALARAQYPG